MANKKQLSAQSEKQLSNGVSKSDHVNWFSPSSDVEHPCLINNIKFVSII